jgi:hypothetical protein
MAEEKKLGPSVKYTNPDKTSKLITVAGVLIKEGESVNLVERLGEAKAAQVLKKLAGNRYFKVDGGPDHEAEEKKRRELDEQGFGPEDTAAQQAITEEARIRKAEGDEAADKYVQSLDQFGRQKQGQDEQSRRKAEQSYQGPEQAALEQPAQRRKT